MKQFFKLLIFVLFLLPTTVAASILDIKISPAQIFDVQWNIQGTTFNASNFTRPYYSVSPNGTSCSFCQMTTQQVQNVSNNNQYFGFFESTTNPGTYGLAVFNQDGTRDWVLHNTGSFRALSPEVVFYNGNNFWGTVITLGAGYNYGSSASFENIINHPTNEDLTTFTPASTEPLAAGETAPAPSAPVAPTPVFASSISQQQINTRTQAFANTTGNMVDLTITGNQNTVDIEQASLGNYLGMQITGNSNIIESTQSGSNTDRNFALIDLTGSFNELTFIQQGNSNKTAFVAIDGLYGVFNITQQGTGEHFLEFVSIGDDAVVSILQEGTGNHSATIRLENNGGSWEFNLIQSGSTNQVYSLPHDLSDSTSVSGICNLYHPEYIGGTCTLTLHQQ
jgi:hypothetical protein